MGPRRCMFRLPVLLPPLSVAPKPTTPDRRSANMDLKMWKRMPLRPLKWGPQRKSGWQEAVKGLCEISCGLLEAMGIPATGRRNALHTQPLTEFLSLSLPVRCVGKRCWKRSAKLPRPCWTSCLRCVRQCGACGVEVFLLGVEEERCWNPE